VFHFQAGNMAQLMAQADLSLGAGGTTTWERCCLGLPSLVASVAENQRELTETLARHGAIVDMGWGERITAARIAYFLRSCLENPSFVAEMSRLSAALVDGLGSSRVADAMLVGRPAAPEIALRPAAAGDIALLLGWANDREVRRNAFRQDPIPWADHEKWFKEKLADFRAQLFILEVDGRPAGQVRFDHGPEGAEIDFSVAKEFRGRGLSSILLRMGMERVKARRDSAPAFTGTVKKNNAASAKAFLSAGFHPAATRTLGGEECLIFRRTGPA
jgi:RimJ/RimL family protein N-acetyltransferase